MSHAQLESQREPVSPAAGPSRARYWVVVFAASVAAITYIDRVCIAQVAGKIGDRGTICGDLNLSDAQWSWILGAFYAAYALFEVPGGWLGDRWGARLVLTRVVVWWSAFTALTGCAWNSASMFVTQALFGAGEAGCFPNVSRAFMSWVPRSERALAQGIVWLCARWGGAFTPALVALVLQFTSWRGAFWIFGVLGMVWAVLFVWWYRDRPAEHRSVNAAELALLPRSEDVNLGHAAVPWSRLARSSRVWLLWAQYTCLGCGWVFYVTWLPKYLKEARHLSLGEGALLGGLPLFFAGLGSLLCGWMLHRVDRLTGDTRKSRRIVAMTGLCTAAACLQLSPAIAHPALAMVVMGVAGFANDLVMPPSWAACMDMGGKFCGTLSGSMNMMTNLGQAAMAVVFGHVLKWSGNNWTYIFLISSCCYAVGAVCWWFLDSVTPLAQLADDEPS